MARLLHLISTNQRRGAETFGVELAEALTARGHEVRILAVTRSQSGPFLDVPVAGTRRWEASGFSQILRETRRSQLTISFGSVTLQAAAVAGALTRRPFIYRNIGDPGAWQSVRASQLRVGAPLRRAARVVAVFPGARQAMLDRYRLQENRVEVIPRGVPAERFSPASSSERASARRRLNVDPNRPWFVLIGSLSEEKAPMTAIRAVAGHPTAGLIVCGDGPLARDVTLQDDLPHERFRFMGPVDDVRDPLAAADALLITSLTEGVPGVAIEAGLCGLPVVASEVGGLPWLIEHHRTGALVPSGDIDGFTKALHFVLEDADRLGRAARIRAGDQFSMHAVSAAWNQLIDSVISR